MHVNVGFVTSVGGGAARFVFKSNQATFMDFIGQEAWATHVRFVQRPEAVIW